MITNVYRPTVLVPHLSYFSRNWHSCWRSARHTGRCEIVICGDFNLHVNKTADNMRDVLTSFWRRSTLYKLSTSRHIEKATRWISGSSHRASRLSANKLHCSTAEHHLKPWTRYLSSSSLAAQRNAVTMRPWKKLDMSAFTASLRSSVLCTTEQWWD